MFSGGAGKSRHLGLHFRVISRNFDSMHKRRTTPRHVHIPSNSNFESSSPYCPCFHQVWWSYTYHWSIFSM